MHTLHNRPLKKFEWTNFWDDFQEPFSYSKLLPNTTGYLLFQVRSVYGRKVIGKRVHTAITPKLVIRRIVHTAINSEECRYLSSLWEIYGVMAVWKP